MENDEKKKNEARSRDGVSRVLHIVVKGNILMKIPLASYIIMIDTYLIVKIRQNKRTKNQHSSFDIILSNEKFSVTVLIKLVFFYVTEFFEIYLYLDII